jgi:hypothetical protein
MICLPRNSARISERGGETVSAVSLVRILANAPNRLLVSASDDCFYVLKLYTNHTKDRALLRESLGTELAASIDLPVPCWRPIYVSNEFINSNGSIWTNERPTEGYYFGSELIGPHNSRYRVYDYLPASRMGNIENRSVFVGALLLDIWANNSQHRQVIFLQETKPKFQAVFIGFREMFSTHLDNPESLMAGSYCRGCIYEECWNESVFSLWQRRIISVKETQLRELVLQLPGHWVNEDEVERIISRLLLDQEIIRELEFGSFDPRSAPWKHPRGLSNSLKQAVTRSLARMAMGV